jgi:predicted deacetylase
MDRRVLISLHDVTPFHLRRLKRAEILFSELGLTNVNYLFVPDYHNRTATFSPSELEAYHLWIHKKRAFQVEWILHGYSHQELHTPPVKRLSAAAALKRRFLTAGEAEFLSLDRQMVSERIRKGIAAFERCLNVQPEGFIAPAWLFNENLILCLKELGFLFTEDHNRIYLLANDLRLKVPVITWATRTFSRKYSSLILCPLLSRVWSDRKVIRIAMHPFDFDHKHTVANIDRVIKRVTKTRQQMFYTHFASKQP